MLFKLGAVLRIGFVAVAVALADGFLLAVNFTQKRAFFDVAVIAAQPHSAAHRGFVRADLLFAACVDKAVDEVDHRIFGLRVKFRRVSVL